MIIFFYKPITVMKQRHEFFSMPCPVNTSPNPRHLAVGWLAEWLTRARVCSVYVQLCGWQAGSFESACVRTLQMSFYYSKTF